MSIDVLVGLVWCSERLGMAGWLSEEIGTFSALIFWTFLRKAAFLQFWPFHRELIFHRSLTFSYTPSTFTPQTSLSILFINSITVMTKATANNFIFLITLNIPFLIKADNIVLITIVYWSLICCFFHYDMLMGGLSYLNWWFIFVSMLTILLLFA